MLVHVKAILPLRAQREIEDAQMYYTRGACVKANFKRNFSEHLYHARECRRFQQVRPPRPRRHSRIAPFSRTFSVNQCLDRNDRYTIYHILCTVSTRAQRKEMFYYMYLSYHIIYYILLWHIQPRAARRKITILVNHIIYHIQPRAARRKYLLYTIIIV